MSDEDFYEEDVYADGLEESAEEDSLVDDDEITAEEEGFMKGYEEASKPKKRVKKIEVEEELE
jgi:hypothetical protein